MFARLGANTLRLRGSVRPFSNFWVCVGWFLGLVRFAGSILRANGKGRGGEMVFLVVIPLPGFKPCGTRLLAGFAAFSREGCSSRLCLVAQAIRPAREYPP